MKLLTRGSCCLAVAGTLALAVHGFGCWKQPIHVYPSVAEPNPADAAVRHRGKACFIAGWPENGRGDPEKCGPFPCENSLCNVSTCDPGKRSCLSGVCTGGYCLSAAPAGARVCAASTPRDDKDTLSRGGCQCVPKSAGAPRDREVCGNLPCGLDGCYVKACNGDSDCHYGLCSSHASSPHGYCVTDDPY